MKVSILITAYRRRDWLPAAVESALACGVDTEVVVVKDHADPSDAALRSRGVTVINEDLPVVGEMLVHGVDACHGDVICFLDDDDLFRADKVRVIGEAFDSESDLAMVRNGLTSIEPDGSVRPAWRRQPTCELRVDAATSSREMDAVVGQGAFVNLSTMSVRRRLVTEQRELLSKVTAATDFSMTILMLESGGSIRITPERLSFRRLGTSVWVKGVGGEAVRIAGMMRTLLPGLGNRLARRLAERIRDKAMVEAFLNGSADDVSAGMVLRTAWRYRFRTVDAFEEAAQGLLTKVAPEMAGRVYRHRKRAWTS
ncbi:MAG: glycosyltransferase family A protein [Thermoplasmata archaeon]